VAVDKYHSTGSFMYSQTFSEAFTETFRVICWHRQSNSHCLLCVDN